MKLEVPTKLPEAKNTEFRVLYKKHYGIELTVDQANDEAIRLLRFCSIIIANNPLYYAD